MKTMTIIHKADKNYISHIVRTIILIFFFNSAFSFGQCNANLKVNQDRNVRSTPLGGTYYAMEITNKGKSADTFSLSTSNANAMTSNTDGSNTAKNVILNVEFLDKNQKPVSTIDVKPGETVSFFAHILVPKGTGFDKWSLTQVIAKSRLCSNYKVDTILHTLVINTNE